MFSVLNNRKQKIVSGYQICFIIIIFILDNRKLFLKTVVKQTLNILEFSNESMVI